MTLLGKMQAYAKVAWENYRSRFNRALGVQSVGFSDGAVCVLPEHRRPSGPTA